MKANEAPEKLYLHPTAKGEVGASWLTFPLTDKDIEYVRKDAFIEKTERYIRSVAYGLDRDSDVEAFISGFVKYMKGK